VAVSKSFHSELRKLVDAFARNVYHYTKAFPKEELYGVTSQLRRAAVSVALNYVEGYARQSKNHMRNYLEISYGSLKECQWLISFALGERYLTVEGHKTLMAQTDRIGAMLWGVISKIR
jgi:four helix bundle protein